MLNAPLQIERLAGGPILTPASDPNIGDNLNGPSLIAAPPWIDQPLGKYYLYFAHHRGAYIRLAVADHLEGPWRVHPHGVLHLEHTACVHHIASPDVHVDEARCELRMYFHGPVIEGKSQKSFVARSQDGLTWAAGDEVLGPFYFRVFQHDGWWYALAKADPVQKLLRSRDGLTAWQTGPDVLPRARHTAALRRGDWLEILLSRIGDAPERILHTRMHLAGDWTTWRETGEYAEVLAPELPWEGVDEPIGPSTAGAARGPVHQLRDPAIFIEDGHTYMLYSGAGESAIGLASISDWPATPDVTEAR